VRARYLWRAAQCLIASSSRRMLDSVFRRESGDAPSASPAGGPAWLAEVPDVDAPEDDASPPGPPPCAQLSSGPAMRAAPWFGIAGDEGKGGGASRRRGREERRAVGTAARWAPKKGWERKARDGMCRPRGESEEPGPTATSGLGEITNQDRLAGAVCRIPPLRFVKCLSNLKGASKQSTNNRQELSVLRIF
jgi:hypothetical protein